MAASPTVASPVPSSSANTIPIPGKSILKRPPPAQQSFFSRIKGFLPTQPAATASESKPLKRAHFILPQIATVYPISSINPPYTPTIKEEKKAIEEKEAERRKRVVRGNSIGPASANETEEWWNLDKVESFYRECCASREEQPDPAITNAFKHASGSNPRAVDLSGAQLTFTSASILSDVFTIEWGLRKVVFRECDLDEHSLKVMLHALLIPGTLSFLSLASNRRLKAPAYRIIGAYATKANSLQFLDLSQNPLDKKSVEYIVAALTTAPEPGLVSLRLDECSLRPGALEVLSKSVRTSSLRNISLRHNRINATGAVALAVMIRDYPDIVQSSPSTPGSPTPSAFASPPGTPTMSSPKPLPSSLPPLTTPRTGPIPPPPRHPAAAGPQTTYTPYIPRSRRGTPAPPPNPLSPSGQPIPIITSSARGGITTRHPAVNGSDAPPQAKHTQGPSAALLDKVRALDALPRLGALRTLDLKGNDLRVSAFLVGLESSPEGERQGGITYMAQVLKRNRTLKVLNLSENKLDVQCLVAIAEALIQSLRTAFTLNVALKRLFLSSTQMTSAGAIALAEFLPESNSLLHLDLTLNNLDIAGVMALSSGLKANHTMRCLDLNIPPGDDEFARMCRDILNSCVRNTEEAEKIARNAEGANGSGRGLGKGVWGMIEESELAKTIREGEEQKHDTDVVIRARTIIARLSDIISPPSKVSPTASSPKLESKPEEPSVETVCKTARDLVLEMGRSVQTELSPERMEEMLGLCDQINVQLGKVPKPGRPQLQGLGLRFDDFSRQAPLTNGDTPHADEYDTPTTPKVDKGKGRAEPEPEYHEPVLIQKSFLVPETDDEHSDQEFLDAEDIEAVASPTDRSRSWVEEEGEVFRKGNVLLGPNEMEGEYAGEDLRIELLEAMVERPPPRPLVDEYGMEMAGIPRDDPVPASPTTEEPKKPPPRPYISRSRSSEMTSSPTTGPLSPSTTPKPYLTRQGSTASTISEDQ
ncbi:hypothetical protein HWV62_9827 [Athelia sp. TMB]|nr:hypothetical protein HWV62_9827 [Athelia sp. TMB]